MDRDVELLPRGGGQPQEADLEAVLHDVLVLGPHDLGQLLQVFELGLEALQGLVALHGLGPGLKLRREVDKKCLHSRGRGLDLVLDLDPALSGLEVALPLPQQQLHVVQSLLHQGQAG